MLHCFMAVTRKLSQWLIEDLSVAGKGVEVEAILKDLGFNLYEPDEKEKLTLAEKWENSRFGRPEWIHFVDNVSQLLCRLPTEKMRTVRLLNFVIKRRY